MKKDSITIGAYPVGAGAPCLVVAEIGPNHDGSFERAEILTDLAAQSGCHGVKFQYHLADEELADRDSRIPWSGARRYDILKNIQEFSEERHARLKEHAHSRGLLYICSPFNMKAAEILHGIGLDAYKIASGEVTNLELIRYCASTGRPVILSSGMSDLPEIDAAVAAARENANPNIMLLQCTSEYPTRYENVQLRVIETFQRRYGLPIGLSDHCQDPLPAIASVALGACMIEKHFTDDRTRRGPDHAVSLEPEQMRYLADSVRNLEAALGDGVKRLGPNVDALRATFLNSIVAARDIAAGEPVDRSHFRLMKPGTGLPPSKLPALIGRRAAQEIKAGTMVKLEDFEK